MDCLDWFQKNSDAIQAFTTFVLTILTGIYVYLTGKISNSAYEQLRHSKETSQEEQKQYATALTHFAFRLRAAIGKLEGDRKHTSDIFTENDITELRLLSRKVNGRAMDLAIQAAMRLREMDKISRVAESKHSNLRDEPAWGKAHSNCGRALGELETVCASIAGIEIHSIPPPA